MNASRTQRATVVVAYVSLLVSLSALLVFLLSVASHPLQGVCVAYDVNTVGTMVEAPRRVNGVVSCTTGTFVEVTP